MAGVILTGAPQGCECSLKYLLVSRNNTPDIHCSVDKHSTLQSNSASQEDQYKQRSQDTFIPVFYWSIPRQQDTYNWHQYPVVPTTISEKLY